MKISIAMATYNGAKYIREQLESFVQQTRLPDELVINDDGSTDETLDIIRAFAQEAPFEVLWQQNEQNLGYSANFSKALCRTTGDLVFLSDQDDVWFSHKIETMVEIVVEDMHNLLFINDASITDSDLNPTGFTKIDQLVASGYTAHTHVIGCCAALKRDLLTLCLPIPPCAIAHDRWLSNFACEMGRKRVIRMPFQYFRRHSHVSSRPPNYRKLKINTRIEDMVYYAKHALNANVSEFTADIDSAEIMVNYAKDRKDMLGGLYAVDLSVLESKLQDKIKTASERLVLWEKPRLKRIPAIIDLYVNGRYPMGYKSAVVDFLRSKMKGATH